MAKAKGDLAGILTRETLLEYAGARSFSRGEDYFRSGRVGDVLVHDGVVSAHVQGTEVYRSKLWAEGNELAYDCTCPAMEEFGFCKHCVALGLKWLSAQEQSGAGPAEAGPLDRICAYLATLDSSALIKMVVDQAFEDALFRERLLRRANRAANTGLDLGYYRKRIKEATSTRGFIDYEEAYDYADGVREVGNELAELLEVGHPAEVVELAEAAVRALDGAMENIDDSDAEVYGVSAELQELHLRACEAARPEPVALARRLFELEMSGGFEVFLGAVNRYKDVLGETGLAEYRRLAETEWARLRPLRPGDNDFDVGRFRITNIMESLARAAGDVDRLVEIKSRNLSTAASYLDIAGVYKEAGRDEDSLAWARKGIAAFGVAADSKLTGFVAEELGSRGEWNAGADLLMQALQERPTVENYRMLKEYAERGGFWDGLRDRARGVLKEQGKHSADQTALIRVLLQEGDASAAWDLAVEGGCANVVWKDLAAARAVDFPEDALTVYEAQLDDALVSASQSSYERVVDLLQKIEPLMKRLGRAADFQSRVAGIRQEYKRRSNLIHMLDRAGFNERRAA